MKKQMYTVYDRVARQMVGPIFCDMHHAPAIRAFADAIKSDKTEIGKHPNDYDLRYIGDVDDANGDIIKTLNETVVTGTDITLNVE